MIDIVFARALHVLAVVIRIGGLAMATTVVLPAVRRSEVLEGGLRTFQVVGHGFAWQARTAVIVAGSTGLYMCWRLELWPRFRAVEFWWMHAMAVTWLLFFVLLFAIEPRVLRRRFPQWAASHPRVAFAWLHRVHVVLLAMAVATVFGAVAGSHGWSVF